MGERECLASGHWGFHNQVKHAVSLLDDKQRAEFDQEFGNEWPSDDLDILDEVSLWIEGNTDMVWEDGELWEYKEDTVKHDPTLVNKWLAELKTAEQVTGTLHNADGFCCLGVLCDAYNPKGWAGYSQGTYKFEEFGIVSVLSTEFLVRVCGFDPDKFGETGQIRLQYLPQELQEMLWDAYAEDPGVIDGDMTHLVTMNDRVGFTFEDISKFIVAYYPHWLPDGVEPGELVIP